jgi:hypothetical protein
VKLSSRLDNWIGFPMRIIDFLSLEGEFVISARDVQKLNKNLSELSANFFPLEKVDHVLDYIVTALNAGSVEPSIRLKLDSLVSALQEFHQLPKNLKK